MTTAAAALHAQHDPQQLQQLMPDSMQAFRPRPPPTTHVVAVDLVARRPLEEVLARDAALRALGDLVHQVLETPQGGQLALEHDLRVQIARGCVSAERA